MDRALRGSRTWRAAAALALALAACSSQQGSAFDSLGSLGMSVPLKPGSFATFGAAALRNRSGHPITLVRARAVRSEHVTVSRIGISRYGPASAGSGVDRHVPGAVPLAGFVVPPDHHRRRQDDSELWGITIEVKLDDGATDGSVVGLEVVYRDGARLRSQRFPMHDIVCRWTGSACL